MSSVTDLTLPSQAAAAHAVLHQRPAAWARWRGMVPGLALTGAIAFASIHLAQLGWLQSNGISALTLAIVLGMEIGRAHV